VAILPQPQQQIVEWEDGRPVWVHPCSDGTERITLPLGANLWQADQPTDTVSPSLSCDRCGTHGWWTSGQWFGVNNAPSAPASQEGGKQ
jgi:hypothetical protein